MERRTNFKANHSSYGSRPGGQYANNSRRGYNDENSSSAFNQYGKPKSSYHQSKKFEGREPFNQRSENFQRDSKPFKDQSRYGGQGFSKKPTNSLVASGNPEEAKGQKMQFFTNQFKMKIGKNAPQIYQFSLKLVQGHDPKAPDNGSYQFTPQDMERAVEGARKKLELVFGKGFIYSGFNLWCTA